MRYCVISRYGDEAGMAAQCYEAPDPFEAIIQDCMTRCGLPAWKACVWLATRGWELEIVEVEPFRLLPEEEWQLPWEVIDKYSTQIQRLNNLISTLEQFTDAEREFSLGLPDMDTPRTNALARREALRTSRYAFEEAWKARQTPPVFPERERAVDLTPPPVHQPAPGAKDLAF